MRIVCFADNYPLKSLFFVEKKCFFVDCAREEAHLLRTWFEKSQIRKDNNNRPSTAMNFEISRRYRVCVQTRFDLDHCTPVFFNDTKAK